MFEFLRDVLENQNRMSAMQDTGMEILLQGLAVTQETTNAAIRTVVVLDAP